MTTKNREQPATKDQSEYFDLLLDRLKSRQFKGGMAEALSMIQQPKTKHPFLLPWMAATLERVRSSWIDDTIANHPNVVLALANQLGKRIRGARI